MQKIVSFALVLLFSTGIINKATAQIQDPSTWTYEVKKTTGNQYELIFHLKLEDKWHIWAMKPGGDGFQIPTSFTFDKNKGIQMMGEMKEVGKLISEKMEMVEGAVNFFSGSVDYVQTIVATGKVKITGSHEYQLCNDNLCLPPKTKKFEFDIN